MSVWKGVAFLLLGTKNHKHTIMNTPVHMSENTQTPAHTCTYSSTCSTVCFCFYATWPFAMWGIFYLAMHPSPQFWVNQKRNMSLGSFCRPVPKVYFSLDQEAGSRSRISPQSKMHLSLGQINGSWYTVKCRN